MLLRKLALNILTGVGFAYTTAQAALVNAAVPTNAYITVNGFEWAWANPLPGPGNGFDLSFQSAFGWRIPTAAELSLAPLATQF